MPGLFSSEHFSGSLTGGLWLFCAICIRQPACCFFLNNKYNFFKKKTSAPASSTHHVPVLVPEAVSPSRWWHQERGHSCTGSPAGSSSCSWLAGSLAAPFPLQLTPAPWHRAWEWGSPAFPRALVPCSDSSIPLDPSPRLRGSPAPLWQSAGHISGLIWIPQSFPQALS